MNAWGIPSLKTKLYEFFKCYHAHKYEVCLDPDS